MSIESAKQLLAEAKGEIITLMQQEDTQVGWVDNDWADEMYQAYEYTDLAMQHLDRAADFEE